MNNSPLHRRFGLPIVFILSGILLLIGIQAFSADALNNKSNKSDTNGVGDARRQQIDKIVISKLRFYSAQFPDMDFAILDSAGDPQRNMSALSKIIGQDPAPLDYEHPVDMRQELLMVTLMRIQVLLQTETGSATLFKPGAGAIARRKQVCVVTINPLAIAEDDRSATEHLLELPAHEFNMIPSHNYLDHVSHLKFALDHEIYHCLDAAYNGAIPISQLKYWSDYYSYKNESGADTYGILMNIAEHGTITHYSRMLKNIRGLTLLNGDIDHYTYQSIGAALHVDPEKLRGDDVKEIFRLATRLRDKIVGSYKDYLNYACAAEQTMKQLGKTPDVQEFSELTPNESMVRNLVNATKDAYRSLTGKALPETGLSKQ